MQLAWTLLLSQFSATFAFWQSTPDFFDKNELTDVVREHQQNAHVFERFTDIQQDCGYLVHDVEKSSDSIAIYIDSNNHATELRVYDKLKLHEKWHNKQATQTANKGLPVVAESKESKSQEAQVQEAIDDFSKIINRKLEEFRLQIQTQDQNKQEMRDELDKIYALLKKFETRLRFMP